MQISTKIYIIARFAFFLTVAVACFWIVAGFWPSKLKVTVTLRQAAYAWDEAAAFHIGNIAPVIGDGYTGSAPGNLYSPYEQLA